MVRVSGSHNEGQKAVAQVLAKLDVTLERGLTSAEAGKRLAQYGSNAIVEKEKSLLSKVVGYFTGPIAYMIEAAALAVLMCAFD